MKKTFLSPITILLLVCSQILSAQYYVPSRKNKALLITNSYSVNEIPVLTNTIEIGRKLKGLFLHGGAGVSHLLEKNRYNEENKTSVVSNPKFLGVIGVDLNLLNFSILNLSHKSYCKYLVAGINIGGDVFKNLQTSVSQDYGYRAKVNISFCIYRSGSHKKDIGYRRYIELGYAFTDEEIGNKVNTHYQSIMLNFLIVKQRLIKFANWY